MPCGVAHEVRLVRAMTGLAQLRPMLIVSAAAFAGCGVSDNSDFSGSTPADESNTNNNQSRPTNSGTSDAGTSRASDGGLPPPPPPASDAGVASGDASMPDEPKPPHFNPYVSVAHDPFSTFAADVDSASYDIFAKSINEGAGLPAPSTVRSEEFVNYFKFDYAQPDVLAPHPFAINIDVGQSPATDTYLLRVGVQGKDLLADRPPANLIFLVDSSCSMGASDKLPLAQDMLRSALDVLRPDDQISLVTYAGSTRVVLPVTPVQDRSTIESAIAALSSRGGTAGADGLELAYQQATAGFITGGINHILLCTDGDFNIGRYSTTELVDIVEQRRTTGVTFTALGFGRGNLNDQMMEAISNAGNGIYRVISGVKTAERYVSGRLLSDVVHIAKDVKLQVEMNPALVQAYRQVGYENRQLADSDFRNDAVDAGEIGSGHQMTALYELVLTDGVVPAPEGAPPMLTGEPVAGPREIQPNELVRVQVRYKQPGATMTDPATEMTVSLAPPDSADTLESESAFAWSVATFAGRMAGNPFVEAHQLSAADSVIRGLSTQAPDRLGFVYLYQQAAPLLP